MGVQNGQAVWCGWHREADGGPWRVLASADDWGVCWSLLLPRIAAGRGGESVVLQRGKHPEGTSAVNAERRARR